MFDTPEHKTLRATLDCIPVAMFAAERPSPDDAFRMLCINRQFEDETQFANVEIAGLRPLDMLSPSRGEAAERRYAFCCRHQRVVSYTETLTLRDQETQWHTVLYPVNLPDCSQRVIGTAFALSPDGRFPAAMPFIDTAMEGLRDQPPMPLPVMPSHHSFESPNLEPAAKVVPLSRHRQAQGQGFREAAAIFTQRQTGMALST